MTDDASGSDELYSLDPGDFVAARNALAKKLRADGDRESAKAVLALRRPTVTAAALNQVARAKPQLVDAVICAGAALRRATDRALDGDSAELRTAAAAERNASNALVGAAMAELGFGGGQARPRIASTVHAAMVDEQVADELRRGVLTVDHDRSGLGLGDVEADGVVRPAPRRLRVVPDPEPDPEPEGEPQPEAGPDLEPEPIAPPPTQPARRATAAKVVGKAERERRREAKVLRAEATRAAERAARLDRRALEAEKAALIARAEADEALAAAQRAADRLAASGD